MRISVAALACVAMLAVPGPTVADQPPQVTLTVNARKPQPDPEDTLNSLGRRQWGVAFHVTISADRTCDQLRYTYRTTDLFDGRPGLDGSYAGSSGTFEQAQGADFGSAEGGGGAGDTVVFTAVGVCNLGGTDFHSALVEVRVTIPPHSCEAGPLRVLRLRGHAWREDLKVQNRAVPLYEGHYVWEAYTAWLDRGAQIVFGAPECGGFRISLRGGRVVFPGSYERRGPGGVTGVGPGARALFVGNQHAGGIETENALVMPTGNPSAKFEVYSYPQRLGRLTRVRVLGGAARVRGGLGAGALSHSVLVRSGYVTTVRCASDGHCRPDTPRR